MHRMSHLWFWEVLRVRHTFMDVLFLWHKAAVCTSSSRKSRLQEKRGMTNKQKLKPPTESLTEQRLCCSCGAALPKASSLRAGRPKAHKQPLWVCGEIWGEKMSVMLWSCPRPWHSPSWVVVSSYPQIPCEETHLYTTALCYIHRPF